MTNWMIVTSRDNYATTKALGFTVQGVKSRHRRKAERMAPGDRVCWYLTGVQSFAATATLTSAFFEGHDPIWVSEKTGDPYPWRFRIEKDHAVTPGGVGDQGRWVTAASLLPALGFVKKWPAAHWRLAFQGNLHELGAEDFATIEQAIIAAEREGLG
ncbi:MAG: EVE domain-containing protein [Chloroflexi bacterium]|nr:EVE domain-containing protein [Chloroflexota bacterium]